MIKQLNKKTTQMSAAFVVGMMLAPNAAHANNFNNVAENIVGSINNLPGLLSALSYIFGILIGTLGILKIKDHVENPGNTPLKDGAIRLAAGGALLGLPIIFESMLETINTGGMGANATAAVADQIDGGGLF
ncbi:MAG: hypothetical protein H6868_02260 [Rhodospirillales bacterium]|nr:hypothetical protein [Rhodospirillales bacterium]